MRRRPSLGVPVLVAIAVAAVVTATHGGRTIPAYSEATTWRGLVGEAHPQVTIGERRIVVLRTPSVAQRLAAAKYATEAQERQQLGAVEPRQLAVVQWRSATEQQQAAWAESQSRQAVETTPLTLE